MLYGHSGVGKTSLIQAGVFQLLRNENAEHLLPIYIRLGEDPSLSIMQEIQKYLVKYELGIVSSRQRLATFLQEVAQTKRATLILAFDQMEEVLARLDARVIKAFMKELILANLQSQVDIRFIFVLRSDYLSSFIELAANYGLHLDDFYQLRALTLEQASEVIIRPAELFDFKVSHELVENILNDLNSQNLIEPAQLSIVLDRLYEHASTRKSIREITLDDYLGLQRAGNILEKYLDEALEKLVLITQAKDDRADQERSLIGRMLETFSTSLTVVTNYLIRGFLSWMQRLNGKNQYPVPIKSDDNLHRSVPGTGRSAHATAELAKLILVNMVSSKRNKALLTLSDVLAGLPRTSFPVLNALIKVRIVRTFILENENEAYFELAHETLIQKIETWMSDEDRQISKIRELVSKSLSVWNNVEKIVIEADRLDVINSFPKKGKLEFNRQALGLIALSAQVNNSKSAYWLSQLLEVSPLPDPAEKLLLSALGSTDSKILGASIAILAKLWKLPLLVDLLSTNAAERSQAALELGQLKELRAVQPILATFPDQDADAHRAKRVALLRLNAPNVDQLWQELSNIFSTGNMEQRQIAINDLFYVGTPRANKLLSNYLKSETDEKLRFMILQKLPTAEWEPETEDIEIEHLISTGQFQELIQRGPAVVKPLIARLELISEDQVGEALRVLILLNANAEIVEMLTTALKDSPNKSAGIETILSELKRFDDPEIYGFLEELLFNPNSIFRQKAARELSDRGWRPNSEELQASYLFELDKLDECVALGQVARNLFVERLADGDFDANMKAATGLYRMSWLPEDDPLSATYMVALGKPNSSLRYGILAKIPLERALRFLVSGNTPILRSIYRPAPSIAGIISALYKIGDIDFIRQSINALPENQFASVLSEIEDASPQIAQQIKLWRPVDQESPLEKFRWLLIGGGALLVIITLIYLYFRFLR